MGMTCTACHTRQIEVAGTAYRIDGGPAFVDFHKTGAYRIPEEALILSEQFSSSADVVRLGAR